MASPFEHVIPSRTPAGGVSVLPTVTGDRDTLTTDLTRLENESMELYFHRLRYDRGLKPLKGSPFGQKPLAPGEEPGEEPNPFDFLYSENPRNISKPRGEIADPRTAQEVLGLFQQGLLTYRFDGTVPEAVHAAEMFAASKITSTSFIDARIGSFGHVGSMAEGNVNLEDIHREIIRAQVVATLKTRDEMEGGSIGTWQDLARELRQVVGMNMPQLGSYMRVKDMLLEHDPPLTILAVDRVLRRLQKKKIRQRATMIARTETMTALNNGRRESYRTAKLQGFLPDDVRMAWMVTNDDRLCPICSELDGIVVGVNDVFPSGSVPPAHPNCRCTTIITDRKLSSARKIEKVRGNTLAREEGVQERRNARNEARRDEEHRRRQAQLRAAHTPAAPPAAGSGSIPIPTSASGDVKLPDPDQARRAHEESLQEMRLWVEDRIDSGDLDDWPYDQMGMGPKEWLEGMLADGMTLGDTTAGRAPTLELEDRGGSIKIHFDGGLYDHTLSSNAIGYASRWTTVGNSGGGNAYHSYLSILPQASDTNAQLRGRGITKTLLTRQIEMYEQLGLDRATLNCNLDVGGYGWAKYGFKPDGQGTWDSMVNYAENTLTQHDRGSLNSLADITAAREALQKIVDGVDSGSIDLEEAAYMLASLEQPMQMMWYEKNDPDKKRKELTMKLGQFFMLDSSWDGVLDLSDPDQMERFWAYVNKGRS